MRQNARKFGLTFWALILAVLLVGMAAVVPGPVSAEEGGGGRLIHDSSEIGIEGSGGGEPVAPAFGSPGVGKILFEQPPYGPGEAWQRPTSHSGYGWLCLEDFWGLTGDIVDIHWYGFSMVWDKGLWYDCAPPTGMEFQIIFYQDSFGSPGAPVATFSNVSPTITYYDTYGGSTAYRFEVADLGMPVSLTKGWVSIQSTYSPHGCAFLWLTSPTGNTNAIQQGGGTSGNLDDNLAFALTGMPPPPDVKYLHSIDGLFNLTDPIGTQWHELWPVFCRDYHLSSWNDTSGDGVLSYCDQIDMYEKPDGEVRWYHVENVTITLVVTPERNGGGVGANGLPPPMYIELEGGYDPDVLTNPVGTHWHEIYPNFCTQYELLDWDDTNRMGLDFCDYILLENKLTGEVTNWHVEEVAIDIIVTIEPPPVGGEAYPVNKASVLAPWIAVAVLLVGGISWLTLRRRRAQS